jgi:hypothetical protein
MKKMAVASLVLVCVSVNMAIADADSAQRTAKDSMDRLGNLFECAAALEPEYASFANDPVVSASARFLAQHVSPRVIRATVFPDPMPDPMGGAWDLVFEFTEDQISVIDRSYLVDPETFQTSPNPLPQFKGAERMTEIAKNAFVACGVTWLGNWEYKSPHLLDSARPESLLPPKQ